MEKYKSLLSLFILFCVVVSCSRDERRLYPYGWTAVDPEFDTVTVRLERAYFTYDADSDITRLTAEMGRLAAADPDSRLKQSRYRYWHGRRMMRRGDRDGAFREFREAIAMTDSARYPYDVARVRWNMEEYVPCTPENYEMLARKIDFFRNQGDLPMEADYCMSLGGMLNSMADPAGAKVWFDKADSLLRKVGLRDVIVKNNINRAVSMAQAGDEPGASKVLRETIAWPEMSADPAAEDIACWNLYLYSGDFDALRKAYSIIKDRPGQEVYARLYEGALMKEFARRGEKDSVEYYLRRSSARDVEFEELNEERDWLVGRGYAALALGEPDTAAYYLLRAVEMTDSIERDDTDLKIAGMDMKRRIDMMRYQEDISRSRRTVLFLSILLAVVVVAAVLVIALRRRLQKQRLEALAEKIEAEHSMRKVLGLQIAMEETDKLVTRLRGTVDTLAREGTLSGEGARRLMDEIVPHILANSSRENFLTTFSEIHPEFVDNLRRSYPGLSDAETRLSIYIALGLDNKHVARLMAVRPESVKQARWRLRKSMGLRPEQDLDATVRGMLGRRGAQSFFDANAGS